MWGFQQAKKLVEPETHASGAETLGPLQQRPLQQTHSTGLKAAASPDCTNRGRQVLSSLWWAVPSCQPDVSSRTAGGAKLYWSPCRLACRIGRERTAGDRVVAERSNEVYADSLIVFFCWTEGGNPYAQRGRRRFVTSTKHQLFAGGCPVVGSAKPSWVHRSGRGARRDPRGSLRWKRE